MSFIFLWPISTFFNVGITEILGVPTSLLYRIISGMYGPCLNVSSKTSTSHHSPTSATLTDLELLGEKSWTIPLKENHGLTSEYQVGELP